jgi:hypothetical protein
MVVMIKEREYILKSRSSGLWRREDGGSMDVWNVSILPQHLTA